MGTKAFVPAIPSTDCFRYRDRTGYMYMYLIEFLLKENLKAMLTTFGHYLSLVNVSVVTACSRLTSRPLYCG